MMLTARDSLDDKIAGLEAGADDYVVKPFALREVEARLLALLRRAQVRKGPSVLQVGDLSFNPDTLKVMRAEKIIELPPIPLKILEILMRHSPRVLPPGRDERGIWGDSPRQRRLAGAPSYLAQRHRQTGGQTAHQNPAGDRLPNQR